MLFAGNDKREEILAILSSDGEGASPNRSIGGR
jgi:hypothetical protein